MEKPHISENIIAGRTFVCRYRRSVLLPQMRQKTEFFLFLPGRKI